MKSSETKRRHRGPEFHKNRFWRHADLDSDNSQSHGPFCLDNLEKGLTRAMGLRRRQSLSSGHASSLRRAGVSNASEVGSSVTLPCYDAIVLTTLVCPLPGDC